MSLNVIMRSSIKSLGDYIVRGICRSQLDTLLKYKDDPMINTFNQSGYERRVKI